MRSFIFFPTLIKLQAGLQTSIKLILLFTGYIGKFKCKKTEPQLVILLNENEMCI